MLPVLLSTVVISFSGVMAPGPMLAVTLAKSYRSPWAGTRIAIGHAIVEVPLALLIFYLLHQFSPGITTRFIISLLGGGMIAWLGVGMFRARRAVVEGGRDMPCGAVTAGILMSALNPFFLLWWATIGTSLIDRFREYGSSNPLPFIAVHWACDLVWLSFVAVVIYRTRTLWGAKLQQGMFILCSLLLMGFGVWYVYSGIRLVL